MAIKWFVDEESSDLADALLNRTFELYAPRLLASEVGNALWRKARRGEIEEDEAQQFAEVIPQIPVRWADELSICPAAVKLSLELGHPVYDCIYLALSRQMRISMVTSDARFANAVAGTAFEHLILTLETLDLT